MRPGILFLFAALVAVAPAAASRLFPPTNASWTRAAANPVLLATDSWEGAGSPNPCVCEPQVVWDPGHSLFRMWYRGGWGQQAVGVATSTDGVVWVKYAGNPVFGMGGSGVPENDRGGQPYVFQEAPDRFWLLTTTTASGPGPRVNVATSSDGYAWTMQASNITLPEGGQYWGNRAVWKEGANDWKLLQECMVAGAWKIFLFFSDDGLHYTLQNQGQPLAQLQRHRGGMYGGPSLASVDGVLTPRDAEGVYHVWYHAASAAGNLPTDIYHASSQDLLNWTVSPELPVLQHLGEGFEFDQVADPSALSVGMQSLMYYDGDNNVLGGAAIGLATHT